MSMHTRWDKWLSENIRYALTVNEESPVKYTYSEYFYMNQDRQGIIDIVGKTSPDDPLDEAIVVEIKGSLADIRTGNGQNFIGKYNFFATDETFINTLTEYSKEKYGNQVGVLCVRDDGSIDTICPAVNGNKSLSVKNDFSGFDTSDEIEEYFRETVIPSQRYMDANKPYYRIERKGNGKNTKGIPGD